MKRCPGDFLYFVIVDFFSAYPIRTFPIYSHQLGAGVHAPGIAYRPLQNWIESYTQMGIFSDLSRWQEIRYQISSFLTTIN